MCSFLTIKRGLKDLLPLVLTLLILFLFVPEAGTEHDQYIRDNQAPLYLPIDNTLTESKVFESAEKSVERFMKQWDIKGASVAVAKEGRLLYARGFGYASLSDSLAVEPYHLFRIASVSKLITAITVMKLQEEGRISVDDKVFGPGAILDDTIYANPKDRRVFDITVGHLLSHEGGWSHRYGDHMFMPDVIARTMDTAMPVDLPTIIRFALSKRLHFSPGTGQSYSNLGYSILGLVIERVSGMEYESCCRKMVLDPLGIYDLALGRNLPEDALPMEVSYYEVENAFSIPAI